MKWVHTRKLASARERPDGSELAAVVVVVDPGREDVVFSLSMIAVWLGVVSAVGVRLLVAVLSLKTDSGEPT